MIIGILSDSHGQAEAISDALSALADRNCEAIVHCGDICNRKSVKALAAAAAPTYLVAGNSDNGYRDLARHAAKAGVNFSPKSIEVPLDNGDHLVATHGHHAGLLDELVAGRQFTYVCHGHTHTRSDARQDSVRIICPGSLSDPRGPRRPAIAVLDTERDELAFIEMPMRT